MKIFFAGKTDPGVARKENQDALMMLENDNVFCVCDGMGGHVSGDFASRAAVEIFSKAFSLLKENEVAEIVQSVPVSLPERSHKMLAALRVTNKAIFDFSQKYPKLEGMGTTISAVRYNEEDETIDIFNVGDSRVYLIRENKIYLRTKDHSKIAELIEEGKMSEDEVKTAEIQSMITRALGIQKSTKIDFKLENINPGDVFILCTDGLNSELTDAEILSTVLAAEDVSGLPQMLIDAANAKGGKDNVSVVALKFKGEDFFGKRSSMPLLVIDEENKKESKAVYSVMGVIVNQISLKIPKQYRDNGLFTNPLVVGALLSVFILLAAVFVKQFKLFEKVSTIDVTSINCVLKIQVRTPTNEQLDMFNLSEDKIQKLQIMQDWYRKILMVTVPVNGVKISIFKNGKEEFNGISGEQPFETNIQRGAYSVVVNHKGYGGSGQVNKVTEYYIITDKLKKTKRVDINIEVGESKKSMELVILPEDQFDLFGGKGVSE